MAEHHAAYVWLIGLVFLVAVTGLSVWRGMESPTGHAVAVPRVNPCYSCEGSPVCAVKGARAYNYENACAAACDGARVVANDVCERI